MRHFASLALLSVLVPLAANADTIELGNQFGTVTILASGITSKGSELRSFGAMDASNGHAFGRVNFTTGALTSGSLWTGGTFSSVGSTFDVVGQGPWRKQLGFSGAKGKVALFTGAFAGTIEWTLVGSNKFFHQYELSGVIQGMLWNGVMVSGNTTQIINTHWNQEKINNQGSIYAGLTGLGGGISTPEPGTLGLFSGGLLTMIGIFRRRMSRT